jgi:hypothetical protein
MLAAGAHTANWRWQLPAVTLALLYLLVDCSVPTNMLLWAIQRPVDGNWEVTSENFLGEKSTREVALQIR